MDVSVEALGASRRQLTLQIPAPEVTSAYDAVVRKIGAKVRLPGFRPGKAPRAMLERRFALAIRDDVLEKLVRAHLFTAIDKVGLRPLDTPELAEIGELRSGTPLDLRFVCEVVPDFVLGGLDGGELSIIAIVADDTDIDEQVQAVLDRHATSQDVDDAAVDQDVVTFAFTLTADGTTTDETERRVVIGGGAAWLSALGLGKRPGDALEGEVEVPADEVSPLAGTTAQIAGRIVSVRRRVRPAIEAVLAPENVADADALRAREAAALAKKIETANADRKREAVLDHLLQNSTIDAPETLIDREIVWRAKRMFGGIDLSKPSMSRLMDMLRDQMRGEATVAVRRALALDQLLAKSPVEISEADIDGRIERLTLEMPEMADRIRADFAGADARRSIKDRMAEEAVLDAIGAKMTWGDGETVTWRDRQPAATTAEVDDGHDHPHGHDHHGHDHHDHDHDHDHGACDDPTHDHSHHHHG